MKNKLVGLVEMTDAEIDVVGGGTHPSDGGGGGGGNTNYGIQQRTHAARSGNQIVSSNTGPYASAYSNNFYNNNSNYGSVHYYSPPPAG
jgi:lysozyme family protein